MGCLASGLRSWGCKGHRILAIRAPGLFKRCTPPHTPFTLDPLAIATPTAASEESLPPGSDQPVGTTPRHSPNEAVSSRDENFPGLEALPAIP